MPKLIVTMRDGATVEIEGAEGFSVMEVLKNGGADELLAQCGGCCSCATCHVHVDPAFMDRLPPLTEDEEHLLDTSRYRTENSRLSCQLRFGPELGGMKLAIVPEEWA